MQHTDPQEISESFNNYFKNVIDDLKRSIQDPTINYHILKEFVNQRLENNTKFEIPPISERKVFEYIRGIDTTKAKGLDEISPHYLKMTAEDVTPSLTYLCNRSLETGQFPKEWER